MTPSARTLLRRLGTLGIAAAGTGVFYALGLPLPFLFGPMFACLIAAILGAPLKGIAPLSMASRSVLGVAVGASVTPATIAMVPDIALSLALLPPYIALLAVIGVPYFQRVCGFDRVTAWYAAMPGGLQDMVLFGQEAGADVRALSLIHATRVLLIVTLAPIIITQLFGASLANPVGVPTADIPVRELLVMTFAAVVGWGVAHRVGLFGASILGPLILASILSLADLLHARPPAEALLAAQFFIGIGIGVGYVRVTLPELRHDVLSGIVYVFILAVFAAVFTEIVFLLGLAPPLDAFLAFAPGGQAEMAVLAIVAGADLGYVVLHHLMRVLLVILGAPIAARLFRVGGGTRRGGKR